MISFLYNDIHRSCLLHLDRSVNVLHCINVLQLLDMWSAFCAKIYTVLVCYTWTGLSMFYTVLMCYSYWIASCTMISTVLVCYTWTGLSMFYTVLMCYSYWICDRLFVQRYTYTWTGLSMFYTVLMCYSYWICDQLLVQWYPPFLSVTPGPVCQCSTLY